jgi:probable HAF family extracellular repeat protein
LDPTSERTTAKAINRHGLIAGSKDGRATVWYPDGRTLTLPSPQLPFFPPLAPPAYFPFTPQDINDNGLIVGNISVRGAGIPLPGVWNPATNQVTLLPTPPCTSCGPSIPTGAFPHAVNNLGQIVGWMYGAGIQAVVWNPTGWGVWGPPQALAAPEGSTQTTAVAINDLGTIVGDAYRPAAEPPYGIQFPITWSGPGHALTVIPAPAGGSGKATAINAAGVVVGTATKHPVSGHAAFLWKPGDQAVTELPGLGGDGTEANAISDTGVIVGQSAPVTEPMWDSRPVRWDPVIGPPAPPRLVGS